MTVDHPVYRVRHQGLLTRDPLTRLGTVRDAEEVMEHPFFAGLDWHAILQRRAKPPFSPEILANTTDTRFFDEQFTTMPVRAQWFVGLVMPAYCCTGRYDVPAVVAVATPADPRSRLVFRPRLDSAP